MSNSTDRHDDSDRAPDDRPAGTDDAGPTVDDIPDALAGCAERRGPLLLIIMAGMFLTLMCCLGGTSLAVWFILLR